MRRQRRDGGRRPERGGLRQRARTTVTWLNGTTAVGLALATLARTTRRRTPDGLIVAGGYRLPVPRQQCFTVGSVVLTRRPPEWLLHPDRADLLGHERRHAGQYAGQNSGPSQAYWLACAWSVALTGGYGGRNVFERRAGLAAGGYPEPSLRPWLVTLRTRLPAGHARPDAGLRSRAATPSRRRRPGSPSAR